MKYSIALLSFFFYFTQTFVNAQLSESQHTAYIKDLEELGYCVIPEVLTSEETKILYERVWHEYIETAWPECRMDNRRNWEETFPMHNPVGIFAGPVGQIQVMWDLRQDPRIVEIFAKIWNTDDLIVSMDGMSFMCPTEIREGHFEPWPHVDQAILRRQDEVAHNNNPPIDFVSESSLKTKPYTIQGQFLFEESTEGDGGFYCIPKSHHRFDEFAVQLEGIDDLNLTRKEKGQARKECFKKFFVDSTDESNQPYILKHVTAPKGSLILWDSRTVHWNQHASSDRPYRKDSKVRMVGFLCYVPKTRLTDKGKEERKKAFEEGVSTGHNPSDPELKYTKDHIKPGFEKYLEDPDYVQPKIILTDLGEALLGLKTNHAYKTAQ